MRRRRKVTRAAVSDGMRAAMRVHRSDHPCGEPVIALGVSGLTGSPFNGGPDGFLRIFCFAPTVFARNNVQASSFHGLTPW